MAMWEQVGRVADAGDELQFIVQVIQRLRGALAADGVTLGAGLEREGVTRQADAIRTGAFRAIGALEEARRIEQAQRSEHGRVAAEGEARTARHAGADRLREADDGAVAVRHLWRGGQQTQGARVHRCEGGRGVDTLAAVGRGGIQIVRRIDAQADGRPGIRRQHQRLVERQLQRLRAGVA
ncbi:conserved hypothetical protein, partial [Ricinus communis]